GRVFITCEADEDINAVAKLIGEDAFVLGSDYPHGDPSRQEDMVAEFRQRKDLSPRRVEKMLSDNPRRLYVLYPIALLHLCAQRQIKTAMMLPNIVGVSPFTYYAKIALLAGW